MPQGGGRQSAESPHLIDAARSLLFFRMGRSPVNGDDGHAGGDDSRASAGRLRIGVGAEGQEPTTATPRFVARWLSDAPPRPTSLTWFTHSLFATCAFCTEGAGAAALLAHARPLLGGAICTRGIPPLVAGIGPHLARRDAGGRLRRAVRAGSIRLGRNHDPEV